MKKTFIIVLVILLFVDCNNREENKKNVSVDLIENSIEYSKPERNSDTSTNIKINNDSLILTEHLKQLQTDSLIVIDDSVLRITGIVRYSGLGKWYKGGFGFESKYQIRSRNKGFYLITDQELERYIGKCTEVRGSFLEDWNLNTSEINNLYTYGLSAIRLDSINEINADCCNNSVDLRKIKEPDEKSIRDTLEGYIYFSQRPSPDINYDYEFKLKTPIPNPADANYSITSLPFNTSTLRITEINDLIEDNSLIRVYGRVIGGYAESYIIRCEKYELIK
ncbi:hypothetical protein [Fulvivirga ligni]|uniref:hypothetical protein n=1 Tax=Fulvivirga ligni TaxID=2904246 RepID=UPI001F26E3F6|nr:hypothetical protein [Fulvivirga ligni]UII20258.1 hypothetical protein LVD16_20655 [Fulvivirga ligni]